MIIPRSRSLWHSFQLNSNSSVPLCLVPAGARGTVQFRSAWKTDRQEYRSPGFEIDVDSSALLGFA